MGERSNFIKSPTSVQKEEINYNDKDSKSNYIKKVIHCGL